MNNDSIFTARDRPGDFPNQCKVYFCYNKHFVWATYYQILHQKKKIPMKIMMMKMLHAIIHNVQNWH